MNRKILVLVDDLFWKTKIDHAVRSAQAAAPVFLADPSEWIHVLASYARAYDWAGVAAGLVPAAHGSDIGGGASIMGTLSGGGTERITVTSSHVSAASGGQDQDDAH